MTESAAPRQGHVPSRSEWITVRGLAYHVRRWGDPDAPPLVLLHGRRDSSITFQFVIDALRQDWSVIAPDWRGHGHTAWTPQAYWFHEFVADLDGLSQMLLPGRRFAIVGHSLGGNVASVYAGLRPERISHLVSLDGFGPLVHQVPANMPAVLVEYLDGFGRQRAPKLYASVADMAQRLVKANRRLTMDKALFLAEHSSTLVADGQRQWLFDPHHYGAVPTLHSLDEWGAIWSRITAPVLWIASGDKRAGAPASRPEDFAARCRLMPVLTVHTLPETSHNLQHDMPRRVAELTEAFLLKEAPQ